jgi:hypothetical protein
MVASISGKLRVRIGLCGYLVCFLLHTSYYPYNR